MQPLASRLRPTQLADFIGQEHLLNQGRALQQVIQKKNLFSLILWGPPGVGKTTLAKLLANSIDAEFIAISAVTAGVKDLRQYVEHAKKLAKENRKMVLFIDEIHRFNKAQQDALLADVEQGTFILIGATTENPSFEINNALLSRLKVYVLKNLDPSHLLTIIDHALTDKKNGLGRRHFNFSDELKLHLVNAADGDARKALNLLEALAEFVEDGETVTEAILKEVLSSSHLRFDKHGEYFYDLISALHKSIRGSDPDAALYWFCRMTQSGCDPRYVARRVIRAATEDIGNADPRALQLALNAADVFERLGSPEGELAIAQAIIYLSCAPKSNAVYMAYKAAVKDIPQYGSAEVPLHLRNAPTKLMKDLGYAKQYQYAHDYPEAYVPNESYFPEKMPKKNYYKPTTRGLEKQIQEKLQFLRQLDKAKKV